MKPLFNWIRRLVLFVGHFLSDWDELNCQDAEEWRQRNEAEHIQREVEFQIKVQTAIQNVRTKKSNQEDQSKDRQSDWNYWDLILMPNKCSARTLSSTAKKPVVLASNRGHYSSKTRRVVEWSG
jgi:hypothetical protein